MSKIRLFLLSLGILFLESVVLAFLVPLFVLGFSIQNNFDGIQTIAAFIIAFMMYKSVIELWLFFMVVMIRVKEKKPELKDLVAGKRASGILMFILLVILSTETRQVLDIFLAYAVMYIPSILITFFLSKRLWMKGVEWISASKNV